MANAGSDAQAASDFERLVRTLLAAIVEHGRLDVAYLTVVDRTTGEELVMFAVNAADVVVAEGQRATGASAFGGPLFAGVTRSGGHPAVQPDSHVARQLGLPTYVSVPVVDASYRLHGALCGASRKPGNIDDRLVAIMQGFADLVSDQVTRMEIDEARRAAAGAAMRFTQRALSLAESEHKLKMDLSIVSGWAATLADFGGRLTPVEQAHGIDAIRTSAQSLIDEVQRMLEEAGGDIATSKPPPVAVDVSAVARRTVDALAAAWPNHTIRFDGDGPVIAVADGDDLRQVIAHLVDNAVKFSAAGTTIEVFVRDSGDGPVIEVHDEGVGIPRDVDIFAAFRQGGAIGGGGGEGDGGNGASTAGRGVGLGLHIVRNLVGRMDGQVSGRRKPERGSAFTVQLPPPSPASPDDREDPAVVP